MTRRQAISILGNFIDRYRGLDEDLADRADEAFDLFYTDELTEHERDTEREQQGERVIAAMAVDYPGTIDYDYEEGEGDGVARLLDANGELVAEITERKLRAYWNAVEQEQERG